MQDLSLPARAAKLAHCRAYRGSSVKEFIDSHQNGALETPLPLDQDILAPLRCAISRLRAERHARADPATVCYPAWRLAVYCRTGACLFRRHKRHRSAARWPLGGSLERSRRHDCRTFVSRNEYRSLLAPVGWNHHARQRLARDRMGRAKYRRLLTARAYRSRGAARRGLGTL